VVGWKISPYSWPSFICDEASDACCQGWNLGGLTVLIAIGCSYSLCRELRMKVTLQVKMRNKLGIF